MTQQQAEQIVEALTELITWERIAREEPEMTSPKESLAQAKFELARLLAISV